MILDACRKELILDLATGAISSEEFYTRYPDDIREDKGYIKDLLLSSHEEKNAECLEFALYLRGHHRHVEALSGHAEILVKLLDADWHTQHERIVDLLEALDEQSAARGITRAAKTNYSYLGEESLEALQKKCIYALSAIGTHEAIEGLRELTAHRNSVVAGLAREELGLFDGGSPFFPAEI